MQDDILLNDVKQQWVQELKQRMDQEINIHITISNDNLRTEQKKPFHPSPDDTWDTIRSWPIG